MTVAIAPPGSAQEQESLRELDKHEHDSNRGVPPAASDPDEWWRNQPRRHYFCGSSRPVLYCFGCGLTGDESAAIWRSACPGERTLDDR